MSTKKTIAKSFTVSTIEDGTNAPFYNEEWYAWSNVESTVDATKSPFEEPYAGWSESIPQQGSYAYLWKKIVKYTYNDTTGQYDQEPAQYFRMSGTNGTSINVKGTIDYAYNSSSVFPPPYSSLNGRRAIAKEDNKIWVCQQVQPNQYAWTPSGNTASDGFSYTVVQGNFNGSYQSTSVLTGHLVMWSNAANDWIDLGKFKGENGTTYYTHYAWATNVVFAAGTLPIPAGQTNRPNSTSVTGGSLEPSEDGSKPYTGILIDTKVSASTVYENYTWSYAKGDKGDIGKVGRFFYYAGDWNASDNSQTFLVNDATTPFFSKAGSNSKDYYVFNMFYDDGKNHYLTMKGMADDSAKVRGQIDWTKAPWQVMWDDYKYLISEAIFADFAKLGSFIVSGDWLISTNGTINGTAYVNGASYNGAPAYTWFEPAYPNTDHTKTVTIGGQQVTVHNFIPNFCVDGLTGTTFQTSGVFSGFIKKKKIVITTDNISEYTKDYSHGSFTYKNILLEKCGTFIEVGNGVNYTIMMPFFSKKTTGMTEEEKDEIRSYIGTKVIIYNKTGTILDVYLNNSVTESDTKLMNNNTCCCFECVLWREYVSDGYYEVVKWVVVEDSDGKIV